MGEKPKTVLTKKQIDEFVEAGVRAIRLIAGKIHPDLVLFWTENETAWAHKLLSIIEPYNISLVPPDNMEFVLRIIGSVGALELVNKHGAPGVKYGGKTKLISDQVRRFKLVRIGACADVFEARKKLEPHGVIPEGHWMEVFFKAFPSIDHKYEGSIGFADPSWFVDYGYKKSRGLFFPVLQVAEYYVGRRQWEPGFRRAEEPITEYWR